MRPNTINKSPCEQCITKSICLSASSNFHTYQEFYIYLNKKCSLFLNFSIELDDIYMYSFNRFLSFEEIINKTLLKVKYVK